MKMVKWVDPLTKNGGPVYCFATIDDAIAFSKENAAKHNYIFKNDNDALEEFITVYWGTIVDVGDDNPLFT